MKFGCQVALLKEMFVNDTDAVIDGLASAGLDGIEVGAKWMKQVDRKVLQTALNRNNMSISGIHIDCYCDVWVENEAFCSDTLMEVADIAKDTKNKSIIMSGVLPKGTGIIEEEHFIDVAKKLEKYVLKCRELGVVLNYHNHWFEFSNGSKFFKALLEYAPSLTFAIDVGWLCAAGLEPVEVVRRNIARIPYIHFRDTKEMGIRRFVGIGEGIIDYPSLMSVLKENFTENNWAIIEYLEGDPDYTRYKNALAYINNTCKG